MRSSTMVKRKLDAHPRTLLAATVELLWSVARISESTRKSGMIRREPGRAASKTGGAREGQFVVGLP